MEKLKRIMLNNPNSCPLRGKTPKNPIATPTPKKAERITDPHVAQPTPIIPKRKADVPIPASLLSFTARRK